MRPPEHDQGTKKKWKHTTSNQQRHRTDELCCICSELSSCVYFKINKKSPWATTIRSHATKIKQTHVTVVTCEEIPVPISQVFKMHL